MPLLPPLDAFAHLDFSRPASDELACSQCSARVIVAVPIQHLVHFQRELASGKLGCDACGAALTRYQPPSSIILLT